jgi:hypothetical protein
VARSKAAKKPAGKRAHASTKPKAKHAKQAKSTAKAKQTLANAAKQAKAKPAPAKPTKAASRPPNATPKRGKATPSSAAAPYLETWQALVAAPDPKRAFVEHFGVLASHPDSHALLAALGEHVQRFSIEDERAFNLDDRDPIGGKVLVVHFRPIGKEGATTWTCAPPATRGLSYLPPSHARALATHNGIAHRFGPYARLQPMHLVRIPSGVRDQVMPASGDKDESWGHVSDERWPVIEQRSDGWYYHRKPGAEGGPSLAQLGHDADGLAKPARKDLTAGDHFLAMTAFEIVSNNDFENPDPRTIWASS